MSDLYQDNLILKDNLIGQFKKIIKWCQTDLYFTIVNICDYKKFSTIVKVRHNILFNLTWKFEDWLCRINIYSTFPTNCQLFKLFKTTICYIHLKARLCNCVHNIMLTSSAPSCTCHSKWPLFTNFKTSMTSTLLNIYHCSFVHSSKW